MSGKTHGYSNWSWVIWIVIVFLFIWVLLGGFRGFGYRGFGYY